MPEVNLTTFSLEGATPEVLEQRRREIIAHYGPGALDRVDDMTQEHLKELAALTAALRRRTTPSQKKRAPGKRTAKVSADDLLSQL